jgi:hypothetical protein
LFDHKHTIFFWICSSNNLMMTGKHIHRLCTENIKCRQVCDYQAVNVMHNIRKTFDCGQDPNFASYSSEFFPSLWKHKGINQCSSCGKRKNYNTQTGDTVNFLLHPNSISPVAYDNTACVRLLPWSVSCSRRST